MENTKKTSEMQSINKSTRFYKKKKVWKAEEESLLITLWGDYINDFRGCRKNSHVYQDIATGMKSNGFDFNPEEVRVKIHNLTNKYRDEKRKVGPSGGSPSNWSFFERINLIFGAFKSDSIELIMDESIADAPSTSSSCIEVEVEYMNDSSQNSLDDSLDTPPQKRNKKNFQSTMLEKIQESNAIIRKEIERSAEVDSKMLELQESLVVIERERNEIFKSLIKK